MKKEMPKEEKLKRVMRRYIEISFRFGKLVGGELAKNEKDEKILAFEGYFNRSINRQATFALRRAGVLPLEKRA